MADEAANLPETFPKHQSTGVDTQGGRGSAPERGIKVTDISMFTGLYKNFEHLSYYDTQAIVDE